MEQVDKRAIIIQRNFNMAYEADSGMKYKKISEVSIPEILSHELCSKANNAILYHFTNIRRSCAYKLSLVYKHLGFALEIFEKGLD